MASTETIPEVRRGGSPADEAFLRHVGERVRLARARRGMSRKSLAKASGVSERYLAELERGAGNASLLVLRQIAEALGMEAAVLVGDRPERPIDLTLAIHHLERLAPADLATARRLLAERFGLGARPGRARIALIGLRGAGKTSLGQLAAQALCVPFIELDREIERASGTELSEIFAVHGQATFRRLERQCLESVIDRFERVVIATGVASLPSRRPTTVSCRHASSCGSAPRPMSTCNACSSRATCGRWPTARGPWTTSGPSSTAARRYTPRPTPS